MAYRPLVTDSAPEAIRALVESYVDMQLHDVHSMLRLPFPREIGMDAGCNFATVSVLCGIVAGASTVFFQQKGPDGHRFRALLTEYYPWADQSWDGNIDVASAVTAIYSNFRNPLAHALAISTRSKGSGPAKEVRVDGNARIVGIIKHAMSEEAVMELEAPGGRAPHWLNPVIVRNPAGALELYPHSFYWGTRRLLEKLFRDQQLMRQTLAWFGSVTIDVEDAARFQE